MKKTQVVFTIAVSVGLMTVFYFVNNSILRLITLEILSLFVIMSSIVAWKKCGKLDEDRMLWLGIWIVFLVEFVVTNILIASSGSIELFSRMPAVLLPFGLGIIVLLFCSNLEGTLSKKLKTIIKITVSSIIISYLVYLSVFAPKTARIIDLSGNISIYQMNYYFFITAMFFATIMFITIVNTLILQIKLYHSDKKDRIDLWFVSVATYLTVSSLAVIIVNPIIVQSAIANNIVIQTSNYLLIPICIFISIASLIRVGVGSIEKNQLEKYAGKNENRMPKND